MKNFCFLFLLLAVLAGCEKSNEDKPAGQWDNAVFIINEGPFQNGTGTIMAFDRDSGAVSDDLFEAANGNPIGNIVQSMTVYDGRAYIMVNNANKIEIVNVNDFKSVATIDSITLPRYFLGLDNSSGLVSCWDNTVKIINLDDFSIRQSIETGTGPDEMVRAGDWIFVVNSGGFGIDSTVSAFKWNDASSMQKITVGHRPSGIRTDKDGNLWVLCSGKGWNGFPDPGDTPAKMVCIDPENFEIIREFIFPDHENHPDNLVINNEGSVLYFNHPQGIFELSVTASSLNNQPLITSEVMFYGLGYDDKEELIYATDPLDYAQNGWIYRYHASDGSPAGSFMAGIVPNGFWFTD